MDNLRIGARLRAARKAAGFKTSKSFLKKYNVPASTYSQHESGSRSPSNDMLLFYSKSFEVNLDWLKEGKGLPYNKPSKHRTEMLSQDLVNLNQYKKHSFHINAKLLSNILEKLIAREKSNISANKIKSISKKASTIYQKICSSDITDTIQNKAIRTLITNEKY